MCTYTACVCVYVKTVSIIQDSMQLRDKSGKGRLEPYVNICRVLNRDMCFRDCVFFRGRSCVEGLKFLAD